VVGSGRVACQEEAGAVGAAQTGGTVCARMRGIESMQAGIQGGEATGFEKAPAPVGMKVRRGVGNAR